MSSTLVVISDTTLFFYRRLKQIEEDLASVRRQKLLASIMEKNRRDLWVALESAGFLPEAKAAHSDMTSYEHSSLQLDRQEREIVERIVSYVKSRA